MIRLVGRIHFMSYSRRDYYPVKSAKFEFLLAFMQWGSSKVHHMQVGPLGLLVRVCFTTHYLYLTKVVRPKEKGNDLTAFGTFLRNKHRRNIERRERKKEKKKKRPIF